MKNVEKFLREINKVYETNMAKVRIGNKSDGGYVVLDELCKKVDTIYSLGIGDDVSFEKDFLQKYPQAWFRMFDPTIEGLPERNDRFIFYKSEFSGDKYSRLIQDNSLLKMDTEYNEWETLLSIDEKIYEKFDQIIVEFHIVDIESKTGLTPYFTKFYREIYDKFNDVLFGLYYRILQGLNEVFYIFHIHPNNSLPMITVGEYSFPPLLEVSFVRKDLVKAYPVLLMNPSNRLDYPNKIDRPDLFDSYPWGVEI